MVGMRRERPNEERAGRHARTHGRREAYVVLELVLGGLLHARHNVLVAERGLKGADEGALSEEGLKVPAS